MNAQTANTQTADPHCWIDDACRRLSDATGWPIQFAPYPPVAGRPDSPPRTQRVSRTLGVSGTLAPPTDPIEQCWSIDLCDGEEPVGRLWIDLPADRRRDRGFPAVRELATLTGELLTRLLTAHRSLARQMREVSTLVDAGRSLADDAQPFTALDRLLQAAVELTGSSSAAFFLLAPSAGRLNLRAVSRIDPRLIPVPQRRLTDDVPDLTALVGGHTLIRRGVVAQAQASSLVRDSSLNEPAAIEASEDACSTTAPECLKELAGDRWLPAGSRSGLCVPVACDAGPLGTLWVFGQRSAVPRSRELNAISSIASQMAAVLERVVLLHESDQQHRMQRDLQSASASQVCESNGLHCTHSGLEVASRCTSRYELGGDLCEVIRIDENRTVVAVGDASGDSVPAAMVMSAVRGSLRTLANAPDSDLTGTGTIVGRINRMLHQITPAHQFMSLLFGVLDVAEGTFTYTNAGHPKPLVIRQRRPEMLDSHGLLLGVDDESAYRQSTVPLDRGDLLVLYSDGVSEARDGSRRMFGTPGIVAALAESDTHADSAATLLERIWSRLEAHTAIEPDSESPAQPADDRTLLVIRC